MILKRKSKYKIKENLYRCECGKEFKKAQSLNVHFSHCLIHRKGKPLNRNNKIWREKCLKWNKGLTKEVDDRIKKQGKTLSKRIKNGEIIPSFKNKKHTKKIIEKISKTRKKYLKENPDKHPWRKNDKFTSKPCEDFKNKLKLNNFVFEEEWMPLYPKRYFSIDVAFINKKIGIEVNGNQHYNSDKTLKKYYKERHDLIEKNGWKLIELHYLDVYKDDIINQLEKIL